MSERFEDRQAVAGKVEWEGGVIAAIEYGLKPEDMPEGDTDLIEAWAEARRIWGMLEPVAERIYDLLDPDHL